MRTAGRSGQGCGFRVLYLLRHPNLAALVPTIPDSLKHPGLAPRVSPFIGHPCAGLVGGTLGPLAQPAGQLVQLYR
jgi:hypothetical protein